MSIALQEIQKETGPSAGCGSGEDGAMCAVSQDGTASCNCASQKQISSIQSEQTGNSIFQNLWQKSRTLLAFLVACFTNPCCTPLYVPLILSLLAGTPLALWMGQNIGWVYGILTLISLLSFVLALRWSGKSKELLSGIKDFFRKDLA